MHKSLDTIKRAILLIAALCMTQAAPAAAIDPAETEPLHLEGDRELLFATPIENDEPPAWLEGGHFHFAKKVGFGYTRHLKLGARPVSIGVRGPVMRKQKALGLAFRIRF